MSKGPPYRYEYNSSERNGGRFRLPESRREMGSPYKRPRRSSGPDFTTSFSYDSDIPGQRHQEVGLGNFNDFSAISRDIVLDTVRLSRREEKPSASSSEKSPTLSIQTSNPSHGNHPPSNSNTSPLTIKVSPTPHSPSKPPTPQKTGSLLSSFQLNEHRFPVHQFGGHSQSSSSYETVANPTIMKLSPTTHGPSSSSSSSASQSTHSNAYAMLVEHRVQPTGLLIQAPPVDDVPSYSPKIIPVTPTKDEVYQPKVEAVSPSNSENEAERNANETPKEVDKKRTNDLLKHMEKVDKEIAEVEKKISDLKEKQKGLEEELSEDVIEVEEAMHKDDEETKEAETEEVVEKETANGVHEEEEEEDQHMADLVTPEPKEKSLIERIYEENRKKALAAHQQFAKLGIPLPNLLPKYNQPSDLPFYEENRKNGKAVKLRLIKYFQRKRKEKSLKQRVLLEEYRVVESKWLEKVEKLETNPKRKAKELRVRDFYEKMFPEIKRQREQTERFSRIGSRANWGLAARSEAEYNEILKDLTEKETHEKHMRDLAVDPPPLLDEDQRRVKFINHNGLIKDLRVLVNERKMSNVWTEKEKEIFKEKYIECPKDFKFIATYLESKSVKDCVLYYYRTKRTAKYKKLARKQSVKKKRFTNPSGKLEGAKSKILKPRTEGYRSESDIDDEEGFDEDSDGSDGSTSRIPVLTSTSVKGGKPEPVETPRWSKNEREIAIEGLRCHGRNWTAIAQLVVTKTDAQCKNFYFNYKKKLDLESVVAQYNASQVQRQESEETISASEVSDDGYDGHNEEKTRTLSTKPKQSTRETRPQVAEKGEEPTPGPSLRNARPQRSLRPRLSEAKTCVQPRNRAAKETSLSGNTKSADPEPTTVGTAGSEDGRIIVDDIEEHESKEVHEGLVRNMLGSHAFSRIEDLSQVTSHAVAPPSSSSVVSTTASRISDQPCSSHTVTPVVQSTPESRRESTTVIQRTSLLQSPPSFSVKTSPALPPGLISMDLTRPMESPTTSFAVTSTTMYQNVPYRPYHVDTHSEALKKLAKNVASNSAVNSEHKAEESEEAQREKVKFQRVPDPQLPKVEQKEAIGIFSRFSPCIPPDTTSRQQVRTQGFPPSSLHPTSPLMSSFVPHIVPHTGHYSPEIYPMSLGRGSGFPVYPQMIEYLQHPGMDPTILRYTTPFMDEAAAYHHAQHMWAHFDKRRMLGPRTPFLITNEMNRLTPPEGIARVCETTGHALNPSAPPSKRCRSVEAAVMHSRVHSPENTSLGEVGPDSQQRSSSLNDVHSWVTDVSDERRASPFRQPPKTTPQLLHSSKEHVPDQVQSYEPFTALMNVAAGAKPIMPSEEPSRAQEHNRKTMESGDAVERSQMHFTRQSCVVTNTSVIQATCFDPGIIDRQFLRDRPRYGISTGLVPKPPPLMPITGLPAQVHARQTLSPDPRSGGEVTIVERTPLLGVAKETPRGHDALTHCPGISQKLENRPSRTSLTPPLTFCHSSYQQHPPPPLVRNRPPPPFGLSEGRMLSSFSDVMSCGCRRGNEPCKHQLYSQEVPYISRSDGPPRMTSGRHENDAVARASAVPPVTTRETTTDATTRGSTHLFRPWMEDFNAEKGVMKPWTSTAGTFPLHVERSELSRPAVAGPTTNPAATRPSYRGDQREYPWTTAPLDSSTAADPTKVPRPSNPAPARQIIWPPYHGPFGLQPGKDGQAKSHELRPRIAQVDTPGSSVTIANNPPPSISSFPRATLLPSPRDSMISVEADSMRGVSRAPEYASNVNYAVSSSDEGLGQNSSDQQTELAATDSDVHFSIVVSSPGEMSSDDDDYEDVKEDDDKDDNCPPDSTPGCDLGADLEDWDRPFMEPTDSKDPGELTEVKTSWENELTGSRDPGESTSYCSSSESEAVASCITPGGIGPQPRAECREPKESGDESSGDMVSNMDDISTGQSDTTLGYFLENTSTDDTVGSSQSVDTSCCQPAVCERLVSDDTISQQPFGVRTGEESGNEMLGVIEDNIETGDDGGLKAGQVGSNMEEEEEEEEVEVVVSCVEDDVRDSEDVGQGEVVSGTEEDVEDVMGRRESDEVVKDMYEDEQRILEDVEGGGEEIGDNMSTSEDCVTSSVEHVDMMDSKCHDATVGGIKEEKEVKHFGDEKEDEAVSGTVEDDMEVGTSRIMEGRLGSGGSVDEDAQVSDEDNTREDRITNEEVRSSDEISKNEHEVIENDDEMETKDGNEEEEGEKAEAVEDCVESRELMDVDEISEIAEDNEDIRSIEGIPGIEEDNISGDKEEPQESTVDTTDVESNVNIGRESEEQDDTDSERDLQDEECTVSSASHSDAGDKTRVVSSRGEDDDGSNEIESATKYLSVGKITTSDESQSYTIGASREVIAESSSNPIRSPLCVSGINISENDEVSTSVTPVHNESAEDVAKVHSVGCLDDSREVEAEPDNNLDNVTGFECSDEPTTTNPEDESSDERRVKAWDDSDTSETAFSGNEAESSVTFDEGRYRTNADVGELVSGNERDALVDSSTPLMSSSEDVDVKGIGFSSTDQEDVLGASDDSLSHAGRDSIEERGHVSIPVNTGDTDDGSPTCVTSAGAELQKYGHFEEISSDEECSELEEGEIAETPGERDDVTRTPDTTTLPQSSGSYFPPLDTIPISPPGSDDCELSDTMFSEWGHNALSSSMHELPVVNANELGTAGGLRVSLAVPFPYSALNLRSASNSNCSSPVPLGLVSGCSTPVIMHRQDSNNTLSEHYEPLSDDENAERESVDTLSDSDHS